MFKSTRRTLYVLIVAGCAGKDGTQSPTGPNTPSGQAATVTLTVDRLDVAAGATTVATWSSTNATSCEASGGWSGVKATAGTEAVTIANDVSLNLKCTNAAGSATSSAAITTIKSTFSLPAGVSKWRPTAGDIDGDGDQEILLPSIDAAGLYVATPPTPLFVLGVTSQRVVNKTPTLFPRGAPTMYAGRVFFGDFDGNGKTDVYTCDRGRDVGNTGVGVPDNSPNLVKGNQVSQNQVFLQGADGTFTDFTSVFPQVLQDSWGCSTGDVDKSGRATIVQSTWGAQQGYTAGWTAKWNGTAFVKTRDLLPQFPNAVMTQTKLWGWSSTADFDKNGYADIMGLNTVIWGDASGGTMAALAASSMNVAGYTFHRGSAIADFNKDGFPDVAIVSSKQPSSAAGEARFVLYQGGATRSLVERAGAFPAVSTYLPSDFGVEIEALDINFDGFDDIVTFGHVYSFQGTDREPRAVWINNGNGTFKLQHVSDELEGALNCPASASPLKYSESYYLKTKDSQAFHFVIVGCRTENAGASPSYVARRVTPAHPLKFTN
ncbi:MAG TPA: VCBS repeat-containing protein [Longimicrobiales bacterium]|nr:VCBS repeat-containing protein [Longimicrobiales bacterium]